MSDLTSTNCGCCGNSPFSSCGAGNNSLWLILLLFFCNGGNGCGCGNSFFGGNDNNCCDILIWIILLSCICGNGFGSSCC